ncbi:MAG: radical SAM protein [Anaerolineae bacterium]|nr:radical SAM protein [Anaerolineae bacterium]
MKFTDRLQQLTSRIRPKEPVNMPPGMTHYLRETETGITRFHLRIERDGSGLLVANATALARLSPSGAIIAKGLLEERPEAEILEALKTTFRGAASEVMAQDIASVSQLLQQLTAPGDAYPVFNLDDMALASDSVQLIAPLQAALPLAPLDTLRPLLERLWEVGIPHVTFFAPQAPNATDLVRAVERAEDLGMIAGVRARASDLLQEGLLSDLMVAGLDHVTFPYAALDADLHDALFGAGDHQAADTVLVWLEENELCANIEIPLVEKTLPGLETVIHSLLGRGADNFSFVAYVTKDPTLAGKHDGALDADAMPQIAAIVEENAHEVQARFLWEPPVERDPAQTLGEQLQQGPRCAGDVAVRVESDGRVIPPRGPYQSAGNLLQDSWDVIWNHDAFRRYRERVEALTRCEICPGLVICAADCPRERTGWAQKP